MFSMNKNQKNNTTSSAHCPNVVYEKKWGVYTTDPWEVFIMNKKGEAILPFSRRPVPVNLFTALKTKMASQLDKNPEMKQDNFHIDENQVRLDFGRLTTTSTTVEGYHRCSTPKSSIDDETQEIVDISKQCLPSESIFTEEGGVSDDDMSSDTELHHWPPSEVDNDDDEWSLGCCDPYESYDWEC